MKRHQTSIKAIYPGVAGEYKTAVRTTLDPNYKIRVWQGPHLYEYTKVDPVQCFVPKFQNNKLYVNIGNKWYETNFNDWIIE